MQLGCPALTPRGVENQQDFTDPGKAGKRNAKSRLIACAILGLVSETGLGRGLGLFRGPTLGEDLPEHAGKCHLLGRQV